MPLTSSLPQAEVHRRCKREIDEKNKTIKEHSEAQAAAEANATKFQEELRDMQEGAAEVHGELREQEAKCEQERKRANKEYDQRKEAQRKEKDEKKNTPLNKSAARPRNKL